MIKIRIAAPFALLAAATSFVVVPSDVSADESKRLVATTTLQDEKEQLPQENLSFVSALKREKRVQVALRGQAEIQGEQLANLTVKLVDENLQTREFPVDETGSALIDNIEPGPHAMVVTGQGVHSATVVYFKEQPDEADASIGKPVEMSAMSIPNEQLLSLVDNYLGSGTRRNVDAGAYNDEIEATFNESKPFDYSVRLNEDGTLAGQVMTVMRAGTQESEVGDTNIVLMKDGKPVARAVTDGSGQFFFDGVRPGVHGLIAAGRGGYSAFAFEAIGSEGFVNNMRNAEGHQFVAAMQGSAQVLPVLLIPTPMVPTVIEIIEEDYQPQRDEPAVPPISDIGGIPMSGGVPTGIAPGGGLAPGGAAPGGFAPGPVGGGGGGAGGGFGGLAALGAIGAVVAVASSDDSSAPTAVSPSVPASQTIQPQQLQ